MIRAPGLCAFFFSHRSITRSRAFELITLRRRVYDILARYHFLHVVQTDNAR